MPLKRVLVVDDDDETRDLLALVVTREGFSAETAWDGRQGLDAVEAAPPDLVILDMMLPGCGGLEVLHALRGGKHRALPVIVVTGRCDDAATIRRQICSAINLIVQTERFADGSRKLVSIAEIAGMEGDAPVLKEIFFFKPQGYDADQRIQDNVHDPRHTQDDRPRGQRDAQLARIERS